MESLTDADDGGELAFLEGRPLLRRLAKEVFAPALVVSFVMTGVVHLIRQGPPLPAEASQVDDHQDEGLRAQPPDSAADGAPEEAVALPGASAATQGANRLRVGVFRVLSNAVELAESLRADGYRPEVVPLPGRAGGEVYYVYAASYDDREEAERSAARLRASGHDVWIERGPLGSG